nr:hypothetical protein [Tanacetum cinerariifolium]
GARVQRKLKLLRNSSNNVEEPDIIATLEADLEPAGSKSASKVAMMSGSTQPKPLLFLDLLDMYVTGTIFVMIERVWDVNAVTGRYLSMDFVVSDSKTVTFHCKVMIENFWNKKGWNYPSCGYEKCKKVTRAELKCNLLFSLLYTRPSTYRYRLEALVADDTAHTIVVMFNDTTTELLKCSAESLIGTKDKGFDADDDLKLPLAIRNLIGTMHGELGDVLVEKKTKHAGFYAMVLTIMSGKEYNNKLYLSSTSWIVFYDDDDIPCLEELRADDRHEMEDSDIDEVCRPLAKKGKSSADVTVDTKKKRKRYIVHGNGPA